MYDLFFETIMGKIIQKRKTTRETQLSEKIRAARKKYKQDMVHRMVIASLESKTRGDVYSNVKNHR